MQPPSAGWFGFQFLGCSDEWQPGDMDKEGVFATYLVA